MGEIISGWSTVIISWANFLFTLEFNDGTSVGGILLASMVLSLVIRFLFRSIQAPPSYQGTVNTVETHAVKNIENVMRGS